MKRGGLARPPLRLLSPGDLLAAEDHAAASHPADVLFAVVPDAPVPIRLQVADRSALAAGRRLDGNPPGLEAVV